MRARRPSSMSFASPKRRDRQRTQKEIERAADAALAFANRLEEIQGVEAMRAFIERLSWLDDAVFAELVGRAIDDEMQGD